MKCKNRPLSPAWKFDNTHIHFPEFDVKNKLPFIKSLLNILLLFPGSICSFYLTQNSMLQIHIQQNSHAIQEKKNFINNYRLKGVIEHWGYQ